jgi:acetoin utilization deacetylase AcuC-like enzyme
MSPTSGFHHAEYDKAEGFCTFNGLMVTAMLLKQNEKVKKIAIIDFDAHYGNGATEIIKHLQIDWVINYSFGYFADAFKAANENKFDQWLQELENGKLKKIINNADIVLYQAGADPHVNDPYGGYLTTEQMRKAV